MEKRLLAMRLEMTALYVARRALTLSTSAGTQNDARATRKVYVPTVSTKDDDLEPRRLMCPGCLRDGAGPAVVGTAAAGSGAQSSISVRVAAAGYHMLLLGAWHYHMSATQPLTNGAWCQLAWYS